MMRSLQIGAVLSYALFFVACQQTPVAQRSEQDSKSAVAQLNPQAVEQGAETKATLTTDGGEEATMTLPRPVSAYVAEAPTLDGNSQVFNFENEPAGGSPEGWRIETTNSRGPDATWNIVADSEAPSGGNVLTLTSPNHNLGGAYNLCWRDDIRFKDGVLELKVHANSGEEDQGGGPIWRVKDKNNYYSARYNPLENNFRLYFVKDGARKMLASKARLEIGAGEWFTIRIVHNGSRIEAWLKGNKLLEVEDATFSAAGGVGFWTKADAATSFDDFSVVFTD